MCANSFVKFFELDECGDWRPFLHAFEEHLPGIRIQRLMTVDYGHANELEDAEDVDVNSRINVEHRIIEVGRLHFTL